MECGKFKYALWYLKDKEVPEDKFKKMFPAEWKKYQANTSSDTSTVTPEPVICLVDRSKEIKEFIEKRPNGRISKRYSYYLDRYGHKVRHGKLVTWRDNGQKAREDHYKDGRRNGHCKGNRFLEVSI